MVAECTVRSVWSSLDRNAGAGGEVAGDGQGREHDGSVGLNGLASVTEYRLGLQI